MEKNAPTINKAEVITASDLKIIGNAIANLQKYSDAMARIYRDHENNISKNYKNQDVANLGPELNHFLLTFSETYKEAARRFQNTEVPTSLVETHVKLTNSFLSSAAATQAIAENENDSASAFAGLVKFEENLGKEELILAELNNILTSNGI